MTALHFRPAREADYPGVERLAQELHNLHAAARPDFFEPVTQLYTPEDFRKLLRTEGTEAYVAVAPDGGIAAYAVLVFRETPPARGVRKRFFCNVDELCVAAGCRRQGVGHSFFAYLEDRARLAGACSIELTEWDFNSTASAFYTDVGLTPRVHRLEKKL